MLSEETSFVKGAFQNYPCENKMVGGFAHYLRSSVFKFTAGLAICGWKICQTWSGSRSLRTGIKLFYSQPLITVLFSYCIFEERRVTVCYCVTIGPRVLREHFFLALKRSNCFPRMERLAFCVSSPWVEKGKWKCRKLQDRTQIEASINGGEVHVAWCLFPFTKMSKALFRYL